MCWIQIPVSMNGMICSPLCFRKGFLSKFYAAIRCFFSVVKFYTPQIMLVARLQMNQLPKHILPHHVENSHHIPPVTHIFQHHQMAPRSLTSSNYIPMVIQGDPEDNFRCYIFPRLQASYTHRSVPLPGSSDQDSVHLF